MDRTPGDRTRNWLGSRHRYGEFPDPNRYTRIGPENHDTSLAARHRAPAAPARTVLPGPKPSAASPSRDRSTWHRRDRARPTLVRAGPPYTASPASAAAIWAARRLDETRARARYQWAVRWKELARSRPVPYSGDQIRK